MHEVHLQSQIAADGPLQAELEVLVPAEHSAPPLSSEHSASTTLGIIATLGHAQGSLHSHVQFVQFPPQVLSAVLGGLAELAGVVNCVHRYYQRPRTVFLSAAPGLLRELFESELAASLVAALELEGLGVARVAVEPPGSLHDYCLLLSQLLADELHDGEFGEDREENFFLRAAVGQETASHLAVGEVEDSALAVPALYLLALNHRLQQSFTPACSQILVVVANCPFEQNSFLINGLQLAHSLEIVDDTLELFQPHSGLLPVPALRPHRHQLKQRGVAAVRLLTQHAQQHAAHQQKHLQPPQRPPLSESSVGQRADGPA